MQKISFIILHYKTIQETIACVNSIEKLISHEKCNIVVVDNGSNDESGNKLKELYEENENIYVLINSENLGFAQGNNIGYSFARENLQATFIAVINNDTIINDENFVTKFINIYSIEKYHVLGPDVMTLEGIHQSPLAMNRITLEEINYFLKNYKKESLMVKIKYILKKFFLFRYIKNRFFHKEQEQNENYKTKHEDVVLSGAFLIFSPDFVKKEKEAFYPGTFMYVEEFILFHLCHQKKYKVLYTPDLYILHKHEASTKNDLKSFFKKTDFFYHHVAQGYLILKKIMEND